MAESGQFALRPEGQSTCVHHKDNGLELFCEKCQDVACMRCVTTVHKGHTMCDLCDVTTWITEDIRRFVEDAEGAKLPKREENIRGTIDELEKNSGYFDHLSTKANTQANRMKEEIDIMTAETLSLYQQLKEENARLLTNYKRQLEEGHANLYDQLQECKHLLQTASAITIFDARNKIKSFGLQTLRKPTLRTASFEPTQSFRRLLEQAFGIRRTTGQSTGQVFPGSGQTLSLCSTLRSDIRNHHPLSYFSLLSQVKVLGQGELQKFSSTSLYCSSAREACVCFPFIDHAEIKIFDTAFTKQKEIRIDEHIRFICIARDTNHIWAPDINNKCIIECTPSSPIVRFHTEDTPNCLCITMDNHVLVGMTGRVTKFSLDGKVILSTDKIKSEKPLVSNPYRIRECHVSRNVVIVDNAKNNMTSNGRVLVLNGELQQLFCYSGATPGIERFRPQDVAFDCFGNIVVAELGNKCILLLDGNGHFMTIIYTSKAPPRAIDVDNNNILWVASTQIERIQYSTC